MSRDAEIDLKRLLVDEENPRLPDDTTSQRDAMQRLADHQGTKLLALAKHIQDHGLNPAQRFIVMKESGSRDYIVLDGNRRLVAMKAVESPGAFGNLAPSRIRALKKLDAKRMPVKVPCVVFADRQEAEPWIRLTHLDQRSGVGQSKWSTTQKAKHEERLGSTPATLQILDYARANAELTPETEALIDSGGFPLSIIDRMLETRVAKPKFGLDLVDGQVSTAYPRDQVLPGLARFINDVGMKRATSRSLNTAKQWSDYMGKFAASDLPDPTTKGDTSVPLASAPATAALRAAVAPARKRDRPGRSKRPFVISGDTHLNIPPNRIHEIYRELKSEIRVDDAPNAAGALIRVLLEMSMTAYCAKEGCAPKRDDLRDYLAATLTDLKAKGHLTNKAANRIQTGIIDSSSGLTTVQAVVHDPDFPVTGAELRAMWDRIQPLFLLMWP